MQPEYTKVGEITQAFAMSELWKWANYESAFWEEMREEQRLKELPLPWPEFNRLAAKRFKRPKTVKFERPIPFEGTSAQISYMDDCCGSDQELSKTGDGDAYGN